MKKRILFFAAFSVIIVSTIIFVFLLNPSVSQKSSKKFNVVFVVCDALRFDVLGCYGGEAETPNIDWIAANGVIFEKAYSTSSVTTPSSISMFTGNHSTSYAIIPIQNKKWEEGWMKILYVPGTEQLLSETLKDLGYSLKMSFEHLAAHWSNNMQGFDKLPTKEELPLEDTDYVEEITGIDNQHPSYHHCYGMLHFLLDQDKHDRFFVAKWFRDPHSPYNPPDKFRQKIPLDPTKLTREEGYYSSYSKYDIEELTDDEVAYLKALYKAEVESIDERMGYILEALKQKDLMDNTYIIFTADHGETFGEHGRLHHGGRFYEELVHVPLIFYGPKIEAGKKVKSCVSHIDLMPTIKELLGIKGSRKMQGKSIYPALMGKEIDSRAILLEEMFIDTNRFPDRNEQALIMDNHKLIIIEKNNTVKFTLYDLINDPGEMKNLYKTNKEMASRMYNEILKMNKENAEKRKESIKQMNKEIDSLKIDEESIERLKALGYIK
jgi:arylsulfatase A-like enzyme